MMKDESYDVHAPISEDQNRLAMGRATIISESWKSSASAILQCNKQALTLPPKQGDNASSIGRTTLARMTKEQQRLIAEQAKAVRQEQERATYPTQLLQVVGRAINAGIDVTANVDAQDRGAFHVHCEWDTYEFPLEYSPERYERLLRATHEVELAEENIAKALRLEEIRKQALSKLTKEEQQALGIGSAT